MILNLLIGEYLTKEVIGMIRLLEEMSRKKPILIDYDRYKKLGTVEIVSPLVKKDGYLINITQIPFPSSYIREQWTREGGTLHKLFKETLKELGNNASLVQIKDVLDEKIYNTVTWEI